MIREQAELIAELQEKVDRLQALLEGKADAKAAKKPIFTENYSADRNKNREKKTKKKSTGRKPTDAKRDLVTQEINIYAEGAAREECVRRRSQPAWRIDDGRSVYVCDHIDGLPDSIRKACRCHQDCETAAANSALKSS